MQWNEKIDVIFNSHKIRYINLDNCLKFKEDAKKNAYIFIDFDYLIKKFLYCIDYYNNKGMIIDKDITNQFLVGFLNMIAHYKNYFYNKHDTMSFYYIFINNKKYKNYRQIDNLIQTINKIILMIPRVYTIYYEKDDQLFYLRYNLMNKINIVKSSNKENQCFYINIGYDNKSEIMYRINKNFYQIVFEEFKANLYGFDRFRNEKLKDIDDIYINAILALIPVYVILDEIKIVDKVRIDDVIMRYIKTHPNANYSDPTTHLLILKMFSHLKRLETKLRKLETDLNSAKYNTIIEAIMNNWKHIVKDKSIMNINELYKIPADKRISIEILVNN